MGDADPSVREAAVRTVLFFGPAARKAAGPTLILRLTNERDPGVRVNAIITVGALGFDDPGMARDAVRALDQLASGGGGIQRYQATKSLATFGHYARPAVTNLVNTIANDASWETRRTAAFTLGRIGAPTEAEKGPDPRALTCLARMLADPALPVRAEAIQGLIALGPHRQGRRPCRSSRR
jgi:HEAT repeat protein